jgi:ribosomal protein S11
VVTAYLTDKPKAVMADKIRVWFDAEADYLEVRFSDAAGYMKETKNDALMERVDAQGRVIGFSVMGVSRFKKDKPLQADLAPA